MVDLGCLVLLAVGLCFLVLLLCFCWVSGVYVKVVAALRCLWFVFLICCFLVGLCLDCWFALGLVAWGGCCWFALDLVWFGDCIRVWLVCL